MNRLEDNNTTVKEVVSFAVEYHLEEVLEEMGIESDDDLIEEVKQRVLDSNL